MAAVASSVSYSPQSVGEPRLVSDEGPSLPHFSLVQLFSFEQFFGWCLFAWGANKLRHSHPAPPLPVLELFLKLFSGEWRLFDGFPQWLLQFLHINVHRLHHTSRFSAKGAWPCAWTLTRVNNSRVLIKFYYHGNKRVYNVLCVKLILTTVCSVATPCTQIYTALESVLTPFSAAVTPSNN